MKYSQYSLRNSFNRNQFSLLISYLIIISSFHQTFITTPNHFFNSFKFLPSYAWVAVSVVVLGICFCCIRRCCRKRRSKDGKKGLKGAVDLKSVQLLGSTYKDKVRNRVPWLHVDLRRTFYTRGIHFDLLRSSRIWKNLLTTPRNQMKLRVSRARWNLGNFNIR